MVWKREINAKGERLPNTSADHLENFSRRASQAAPPGAKLLNMGPLWNERGPGFHRDDITCESADWAIRNPWGYFEPTHLCEPSEIPVEDGRYDLILCTQVIERVPDPKALLAEIGRVLRPRGSVWLTAPLTMPEHGFPQERPRDSFRYTRFALQDLMREAGFKDLQMDWLEGYFGTLAHETWLFSNSPIPRRPSFYGGGVRGTLTGVSIAAAQTALRRAVPKLMRMDQEHRLTTVGVPRNYTIIARKPASAI